VQTGTISAGDESVALGLDVCTWIIAPKGASNVSIWFSRFNLNNAWTRAEKVYIDMCSNPSCTSATVVKGSPFGGSVIPILSVLNSGIVRVRYETKYAVFVGPSFVLHYVSGTASTSPASTCVGVQRSAWNQVALALERTSSRNVFMSLHLNGTFVAAGSKFSSSDLPRQLAVAGSEGMAVGRVDLSRSPYGYFTGRISELRIWNRARSQSETGEDMNRSCFDVKSDGVAPSSLTACYSFEVNTTSSGGVWNSKFDDLGMLPKIDARIQNAAKALPWCGTLSDGGRLRNGREVDIGESWGFCTPKPRLPGLGFNYDSLEFEFSDNDLTNLASLPAADVLDRFPACGIKSLHFEGNHADRLQSARTHTPIDKPFNKVLGVKQITVIDSSFDILPLLGRHGGGLMHAFCNDASDRRGVCVFSGRNMGSSAHIVSFEGNSGMI
jgi:hypothetical protein